MQQTRVFIDLSRLCLTSFTTGIQRVAKEIVLRLLQDPALDVTLLSSIPPHTCWRIIPNDAFTRFYTVGSASVFGDAAPVLLTPQELPTNSVFFDIDSAWNMPMQRSWLLPILKKRGITIVSQLYDLIPVTEPQYFHALTMQQFLLWTNALLQYADKIICNAFATGAALETLCAELEVPVPDYTVVPLGADFAQKTESGEEPDHALLQKLTPQRFLLAVGTIEPRKNHALILEAADALHEKGIDIVFAGRIGWNMDVFAKKMQQHPLNGRGFYFADSPNDATVAALYRDALAVVFPTKNEGFGLPVTESFLHGTPVLCSDIPVLHEVGGELAVYFDNSSPQALVTAVSDLLTDETAYKARRQKIANYAPRKWDQAAAEMSAVLRACSTRCGSIPHDLHIRQAAVLTARPDDLLHALPYWEALLPFLSEIIVCCPEKQVSAIKNAWSGKIALQFCTDETLLDGMPLPEDHTERNFLLRCLMIEKAPLDDIFLMTDDDCLPLVPLTEEFFLREGRLRAFYCNDLRDWRGTQGAYTSYDKSMFRTRNFLLKNDLPTLQYSAHQMQLIDRRIYRELLLRYPEIRTQGLDEWSTYFNFALMQHPDKFSSEPYCTLGFPAAASDWEIHIPPQTYYFENYYPALYEEGQLFAQLKQDYDPTDFAQNSAEKISRYTKMLQNQAAAEAALRTAQRMYLTRYRVLPELSLRMINGQPVFQVPALLELPGGAVLRLPLRTDSEVRALPGAVLRYGIRGLGGGHPVPEQSLALDEIEPGSQPELTLSLPPIPMRGILTLTCAGAEAQTITDVI